MPVVITTINCHAYLNVGCCNLRSLVEVEALVTSASTKSGVSIDCKINFLIEEMHWFEMSITGVSETINGLELCSSLGSTSA